MTQYSSGRHVRPATPAAVALCRAPSHAVEFRFAPMTESDAHSVARWRYTGPYAAYDCPTDEADDSVRLMLDPANQYFAARDRAGALVGYCCFGPDARVPGGDYADESALDVGLGLHPDLTGHGLGPAFVRAIASLARERLVLRRFGGSSALFVTPIVGASSKS